MMLTLTRASCKFLRKCLTSLLSGTGLSGAVVRGGSCPAGLSSATVCLGRLWTHPRGAVPPPQILPWRSLGSGIQEARAQSTPPRAPLEMGGKKEGCPGQALQKQLGWMGEELGEKGTLNLETRKRHEGERSDES